MIVVLTESYKERETMVRKEREYVVERPIWGTQTLTVIARSKKEALQKVDLFEGKGIDFQIHHYGKARDAFTKDNVYPDPEK